MVVCTPQGFVANWPNRLWNMTKKYHYIGGQGAGGMGYGAPASIRVKKGEPVLIDVVTQPRG